MKRCIWILFMLCFLPYVSAESKAHRKEHKHQLRIGISDDFLLRSMNKPAQNTLRLPSVPPPGYFSKGNQLYDYRSTGHLFVDYQYRLNDWFAFGVKFDTRTELFREANYEICSLERIVDVSNHYQLNLSLLPMVRFTYFNRQYVSLYSSVAIGPYVEIQDGGLEFFWFALDVSYFGISVGDQHWFCDLEFGIMPMPYLFDGLLRLGIGYRF